MWIQRLLKLFGFLANFPLEFLYDYCSDKFTSLLYLVVVTDCRFADNIDWIQQVDPVGYGSWRRVGPGQETADVDAADEPGKQTSYFRRRGTSSFGSGLAVKTCFYLPFFLIYSRQNAVGNWVIDTRPFVCHRVSVNLRTTTSRRSMPWRWETSKKWPKKCSPQNQLWRPSEPSKTYQSSMISRSGHYCSAFCLNFPYVKNLSFP